MTAVTIERKDDLKNHVLVCDTRVATEKPLEVTQQLPVKQLACVSLWRGRDNLFPLEEHKTMKSFATQASSMVIPA